MKRALLAVALTTLPTTAVSTTAPDLSARIVIDGAAVEYAADEWVLDGTSPRPERANDSRWGADNDVRRIAATWDSTRLYIAVDCATFDSGLMLWIEYRPGGVARLDGLFELRRQISFSDFAPNCIVDARPGEVTVSMVSAGRALQRRSEDEVPRAFDRTPQGGALELAIPWAEAFPPGGTVRLVAAITGGPGSGAGDGAPDPSVSLPPGRTDPVTLDQVLAVTVDADRDGAPDTGVAPRSVSAVEPGGIALPRSGADIEVLLTGKTLAPDLGETVEFALSNPSGDPVRVYATCSIYGIDGRLVRVLYEDDARTLNPGVNPIDVLDRWDGRDARGGIVPGGIYAINLVWGEERGAREGSFNASVAIVR